MPTAEISVRDAAEDIFDRGLCCGVELPDQGAWVPFMLVLRSGSPDDVVRVVAETELLGRGEARVRGYNPTRLMPAA